MNVQRRTKRGEGDRQERFGLKLKGSPESGCRSQAKQHIGREGTLCHASWGERKRLRRGEGSGGIRESRLSYKWLLVARGCQPSGESLKEGSDDGGFEKKECGLAAGFQAAPYASRS